MPLTGPSGTVYRACQLDTNALSEMAKRPAVEGIGYLERFPPDRYVPCMSVYSLFEIRRHSRVYSGFLEFFRNIPIVLLLPYRSIVWAELRSKSPLLFSDLVAYWFASHVRSKSVGLDTFIDQLFASPAIAHEEQSRAANEQSVLRDWLTMKSNFKPSRETPTAKDADRYVDEAYLHALAATDSEWMSGQLASGVIPKVSQYPGVQVMLYSQYYRLFEKSWHAKPSEVTDVMMSCCSPYVDAMVTERFQANVLSKLKQKVRGLESIEIARLRDIRRK